MEILRKKAVVVAFWKQFPRFYCFFQGRVKSLRAWDDAIIPRYDRNNGCFSIILKTRLTAFLYDLLLCVRLNEAAAE